MKLEEFLEKWEWKDLEEANNQLEKVEKKIHEICVSVNIIDEIKNGTEALIGKSYEQIVDEHKSAFCKLADRDCPALDESEIRADERRKVCEEFRKGFREIYEKGKDLTISQADFSICMLIAEIEGGTE